MALVLLRDRYDEAEVRVHHLVLRRLVALLDPLRQLHLFGRGEQRVAAGLVEEELERVARHRGDLLVSVRRLLELRDSAVVGEVDPLLLELLVQGGDVLVVQLELLDEPDERRQVDAAQLLAVLHQHPQLLRTHALSLPGSAAS